VGEAERDSPCERPRHGEGHSSLVCVTFKSRTHGGFAAEAATFRQVAGGMPYILSGLKTLLETGKPLEDAGAA
jgi:hypothetical protein